MVANVVPPGTPNRTPGCGIQFYGVDGIVKQAWEGFIGDLQRHRDDDAPVSLPAPESFVDPVRRQFQRYKAEVQLHVEHMDELQLLYSRDVSRGGMLIATDMDFEVGHELVVKVLHPENGTTFSVDCVVRRVVRQADFKGIGVEFLRMTEGRRSDFVDFVSAGIQDVDDDEITIVDDMSGLMRG